MSVAAINKLIIAELGKMKNEKGDNLFTGAELRWISATVGATVSKAVGGNAGQGAGIADSATKNNYLTQQQYDKMIADTKRDRAALAEGIRLSAEQEKEWYAAHKGEAPIGQTSNGDNIYQLYNVGIDPITGSTVYLDADGGKVLTGGWYASADVKNKIRNTDLNSLGPGEFRTITEYATINGVQMSISSTIDRDGNIYSSASIGKGTGWGTGISDTVGYFVSTSTGETLTETQVVYFTGTNLSGSLSAANVTFGAGIDEKFARIMVSKGADIGASTSATNYSVSISVSGYVGSIKK